MCKYLTCETKLCQDRTRKTEPYVTANTKNRDAEVVVVYITWSEDGVRTGVNREMKLVVERVHRTDCDLQKGLLRALQRRCCGPDIHPVMVERRT
jgi:hypothetical protein